MPAATAGPRALPCSGGPHHLLGRLISGIAVLLAGCGHHAAPPAPPPPKVSIVTVQTQAVPITTELPGRASAVRTADVRPQVNGIILKRLFVEGSDVKAGQQLYQIDPAPYKAAYDSAVAPRKLRLGRSRNATSPWPKPMPSANRTTTMPLPRQLQARAAVETARINLVYTRVLSPISGRIGRSPVTEGALVTANQTAALATVQQLDPIYVDVTQPSTVLLRLKRELAAGELCRRGGKQAQVRLMLEDGSVYQPPGQAGVRRSARSTQTTGSVTLRALFPNPGQVAAARHVRARADRGGACARLPCWCRSWPSPTTRKANRRRWSWDRTTRSSCGPS